MRVPVEWLKDVVSVRASADQLAKMLTGVGLETVADKDNVLEVDIIPNRADCWSVRGIARDVAALTKTKVKSQKLKIKEISKRSSSVVKVEVRDRDLCPRYMARVIEDVKITESPAWLKKRLELAGVRAINNVVDVTNYLLLEIGQPMHAFDANLITEGRIIVRRANPKEKVTTLDGAEHYLDKDMLVIADAEKVIAVAGVMGAANTEVKNETKTIILESAFFDPISVYKTSKKLLLRSESSVRFEHGVDWLGVEEALDRAAAMIAQLGKGWVLKGKIDIKNKDRKPKIVTLRPEKVNQLLRTNISTSEMMNILKRLGFGLNGVKVTIPLFRAADVYREIDLIEEIARIYGYGQIPVTMPSTAFSGKQVDQEGEFRQKIAEIMVGCGFMEAQTYSFVGPKDFTRCSLSDEKAVKVTNPMNIAESYLRTMILPGLLNVVVHNLNRQIDSTYLFEIGKVFKSSNDKLPKERWVLCGVATGSPFMSEIDKGQVDYFYLKGVLENLFAAVGVLNHKFFENNHQLLQPGKGAEITGLGLIGELHPEIRANYDLKKSVCFFEIDLSALRMRMEKNKTYQPLPKFPSVSRDIAMYVPRDIEYQMIVGLVKKTGGDLVEDVYLFDKYKDSQAYRIVYRNEKKTLVDAEVSAVHAAIMEALESKLNIRVRR